MTMKITNRTGDVVTVRSFKHDDPSLWAALGTEWYGSDLPGSIETDGWPKLKIAIYEGQVSGAALGAMPCARNFDISGDFDDNSHLVLLRGQPNNVFDRDGFGSKYNSSCHLGHYGALDVNNLKQAAEAESTSITQSTTGKGLNKALAEVRAVTDAVQKSLAELAKIADSAATMPIATPIFGLLSILLIALAPDKEPPPPPTIDEITDAVKTIVTDALDQDKARDVAISFVGAAQFCGLWAAVARANVPATGDPQELGDEEQKRFELDLRDWVHGNGDFQRQLRLARGTPAVTKYILPSFVSGLLADLQMQRMDLMIRVHHGHTEIPTDLTKLKDLATGASAALDKAASAFVDFSGDSIATKYHLYNRQTATVPELKPARDAFTLRYTGAPDLGFVDAAKVSLNELHQSSRQRS